MDYSFLLKTQPKLVKLFNNGFKKNRLSQVYLLDGVKGTPKTQAAMYFANMLLCDTHDFCGKCINCKRISENVHPRIMVIEPDAQGAIKKDVIEVLENEYSYSGLEEGARLFIIKDIEKATLGASNGLLKFLEEMNDNCYGILLTSNLSAVLDTVKSRSQIITLEKISNELLKEAYLSKGINDETAKVLCTLTNNVEEGLELIENDVVSKTINLVKKVSKTLVNDEEPILVMNDEGKFLLTNVDKQYHQMFMDLLITITNDKVLYLMGEFQTMVFDATVSDLLEYEIDKTKIDIKILLKQLEIMLEARKRLEYNVNIELFYMDLFIKCKKAFI